MMESSKTLIVSPLSIDPPPNPMARISEVAIKLGVKPYEPGTATVLALGADGNIYDVWEIASAFLDAMERATNPPEGK